MRYIIRNLRGLWKQERLIFGVMLLCILASSLILNFSYGLYQNYHVIRDETQLELKEVNISVQDGKTLTKGQFEDYLMALPEEVRKAPALIFCDARFGSIADHVKDEAKLDAFRAELEAAEEHYQSDSGLDEHWNLSEWWGGFDFRIQYVDGGFVTSQMYLDIADKQNDVTEGRWFTPEEELNGEPVAIAGVLGDHIDHYMSVYDNALRIDDEHISVFGQSFRIVGKHNHESLPQIPFSVAPDDLVLGGYVAFMYDRNVDKGTFDTLKKTADEVLPDVFVFEELSFPDNESMYLYSNIMLIAALIAVLSILNFAMLYYFILKRRSRTLAIYRICGCKIGKAVRMYLGECLLISLPVYALGLALYIPLMKQVLADIFIYMEESYSPWVYAAIFGMYLGIMLIMLTVMIYCHVRRSVLDAWKQR